MACGTGWMPVSLFGGLAVGGTAVHPPAGAPWRIVAWLSLYGSAPREELAGTLWPDATETRANGNLRTGLWRVRARFPDLLRETGAVVALAQGAMTDLAAAVEAARTMLLPHGDLDAAELRRLVDDPRLLPGWYEDWVVEERERFRLLRLHALERAAHRLARRGEFGAATEAALAAVRTDPLRESAHRVLIEVHLGEGNVAEARRQYEACVRVLDGELHVGPSPALAALLDGRSV